MKRKLLAFGILVAALTATAQTPRLSLFEEFTGETCPPCASTNPGLNAILLSSTNASKIIAIKWQVPIPSAPTATWSLYQTNKAEIDYRYKAPASGGYGYASQANASATVSSQGVNSAPSGRIDGQHQWVFGAASDHPTYISNAVISSAQSNTAAFSITMTRAWDATCSSVNLTVNVVCTAPFTAVGPLVFRTVMVERLIQFATPPGSNGEMKFEDVGIKSFPDLQNGTPMAGGTWTVGQSQTFVLNCQLPSYVRKKEEVAFVGFIQDDGNRKVAQACRADKVGIPNWAVLAGAKVGVTCNTNITPVVSVRNDGLLALTAMTISPKVDGVTGADFPWTGNLAPGATTDITLTTMSTPTASGTHSFKYDITALSASPYYISISSNTVAYLVAGTYQGTPVVEGFAAAAFPPTKWTSTNFNGGPGWSRVTGAGGYNVSQQAIKYDFFNNTKVGDKDELFLPPMDLSGTDAPIMTFDLAYEQRTATSNDQLEVYVSDDCGANWHNVFTQSGTNLMTVPSPNTSAYFPDNTDVSQWKTESVTLTGYNKANVLVKFVTTSDNGNNLFLDNVNLSQPSQVGISKANNNGLSFDVRPNPSNGLTVISINSTKAAGAKVSLVNTIGQVVYEKNADLSVGANTIQVDVKNFASGVYYINVESANGTLVKKLVVTN